MFHFILILYFKHNWMSSTQKKAYKHLRVSYIHGMSPTCFGYTCGHPQGGALQKTYHKNLF
jgi:hypothetical protein